MNGFTKTNQWKSGEEVASFLDNLLKSYGYSVAPTTAEEERVRCLGDRKITKRERTLYVEYKSGIQTHYTGNVFIETISVDTANKSGWLYTCKADWLLYACILDGCVLCFRPDSLRDRLCARMSDFRTTSTSHDQNKGYRTHGILVPLREAISIADRVIHLDLL